MSAEALASSWRAHLALGFERSENRPEGEEVCHAIIVHPPGGIAGGDDLSLEVKTAGHALLTTPGATKWYRSAGPWAKQKLTFEVDGTLEWLPRETIVFDGALAQLECEVRLGNAARYIGWEIVCLGRTGSGERFSRGKLTLDTRIVKDGKPLWVERGEIEGGGALMRSPIGLHDRSVFGTFVATGAPSGLLAECRKIVPAVTLLPGLLIARYLGDSTEAAFQQFSALWTLLRPAVCGRDATEPRIWRT